MAKPLLVFVYGTLKAGRGNHGALEGSRPLGRATIRGRYAFVSLGWYPGVVVSETAPDREIGGEVYEISQDTLATLDMIEGHPTFYERRKVVTSLGKRAWCYMLPETYTGRDQIADLFWRPNESEAEWSVTRGAA